MIFLKIYQGGLFAPDAREDFAPQGKVSLYTHYQIIAGVILR